MVVPSRAAERVAGQGGARQDYDEWDSSESDDGFCIQTDRSQGAEDEYTLDFNQNAGKRIDCDDSQKEIVDFIHICNFHWNRYNCFINFGFIFIKV